MALILNSISGSGDIAGTESVNARSVVGVTGSFIFHPGNTVTDTLAPGGVVQTVGQGGNLGSLAVAHQDAAYIFSGSIAGNDKTLFLGDVFISGTLNAGTLVGAGVGDVIKVGSPANNQLGVFTGDGTLEGEADLTFDNTDLFVGIGDNNTTTNKIKFQNSGLSLGPTDTNIGGLVSAGDFKLVVSGGLLELSGTGATRIGGSVHIGPDGLGPATTSINHSFKGSDITIDSDVSGTFRAQHVYLSGSSLHSEPGSESVRILAATKLVLDV